MHKQTHAASLLLEYRTRRHAGETLTAEQFIVQRTIENDPELVVDIAFADFLESEKFGEQGACERLCRQLPAHADEIRRQVTFHRAITGPTTGSLLDYTLPASDHLSQSNVVGNGDGRTDGANWLSIPGLELLQPLGRGGMGIVYLAHQPKLNRKVAVKLLLAGIYASPSHIARFRAEAQAAASLRHPNIVQIDEIGEAQGQPYLVMEFVEGGTLESFLKQYKASPRESAEFVLTLARALHQAHLKGIVHRDLKPGNIMLARLHTGDNDGTGRAQTSIAPPALSDFSPKITDFGLAKILVGEQLSLAGPTLTIAGDLLGTPSYMAPEQARGGTIGSWSDVYSLGAILYELLSGKPPFLAITAWETLEQVLNDEPPALPSSVPINLRTICLTCLRKEPNARYSSMNLVVSDLERYLQGKPIAARRASTWDQVSSWCKRNKAIAILGSTVFLTLSTILGITIWSRTQLELTLRENELARRGEAAAHASSLGHLWDSVIAQAQAQQSTGRAGHRVQSLASVAEAQKLLDQIGRTDERENILRDTAAACLPLDDFQQIAQWQGPPVASCYKVATNGILSRVAQITNLESILVTEDFGSTTIFETPSLGATHIALSPTGRWLAAWSDVCRIYDLQSSRIETVLEFNSGGSWGFSPDGKWLVGADREGTIVVDLLTRRIKQRISEPAPSFPPAFSNDSRNVALVSPGSLVVVDLESGSLLARLDPPPEPYHAQCMAWHPNNLWLAVCGYRNDIVALWNTETKQIHRRFRQPGYAVAVAFDGSGHNVITSSAWLGEVNVFDLESEVLRLSTRALAVRIASSADSGVRMIVSSVANANAILEIQTQKVIRPYRSDIGSPIRRFASTTSPNQRWLAVCTDRGVEIYNKPTKTMVAELPIGLSHFNRIVFDSSQRLWVCMHDGWLRWTFDDSKVLAPIKIQVSAGFEPVDIDRDAKWSLCSNAHQVKLESLTQPHRQLLLGDSYQVRSASFSPDGAMVATGEWNGNGAKVWSTSDGRLLAEFKTGPYCNVQFSPDSKYLFTSPNGGEIRDTTNWEIYHQLKSLNMSAGGGFAFAFSHDSKWLAYTHTAGQVAILDVPKRQLVNLLRDPDQTIPTALTFSQDQGELEFICSGPPSSLRSWDLRELCRELQNMGIDTPDTTFERSTLLDVASTHRSPKPLQVERNQLMDALVAGELMFKAEKLVEDRQWLAAFELYKEAYWLRLSNLLRKYNIFQ